MPSLRREQISLTALSGLCVLYCVAALWYVTSSPEVPVRCVLGSDRDPKNGIVISRGPQESEYRGRSGRPVPKAGDRLLALGGSSIHSFVNYARAQADLRKLRPIAGGRLWIGSSPEDLTDTYHRIVEHYDGTRYVRVAFQPAGAREVEHGWLRLSPQPLGPLTWTFVWFLLQLPIVVLTGMAYWNRPDDQAVKLFFVVSSLALVAYSGGNHWWVVAGSPVLACGLILAAVLLPPALLHFFLVYPSPSPALQRRRGLCLTGLYAVPAMSAAAAIGCALAGSLLSRDWGETPLASGVERWMGLGAASVMGLLRTGVFAYVSLAALMFVASMVCLVRSYLQAHHPMERAQVKWILWAGLGAALPICYTLYLAAFQTSAFAFGAARAPMAVASALFMIAYAVGIARYKLMLVDQVLSRGMWYYVISFGLACGSSLLIAAAAVASLRHENPFFSHPLPLVLVLAVSLLAAGWFRDRFQRTLDRRFFREKYPLDKALQRINRAVTHVLERQAVAENLLSSCCEALRVDRAALYLQDGDRQRFRLATVIGRMDVPRQFSADDEAFQALAEETAVQRVPSGVSPVQEWLRRFSAELIQGLESEGEIIGVVVLGAKANGAAYTAEDVTFITAIGRVTGVALHCAKVHEDVSRLTHDLQEKTQLISEQGRRIAFLQAELSTAAGPRTELAPTEFRRDAIRGKSPAIERVLDTVRKVAASESSVLLRGESGTGKELLARAIHDNSPRRDGPLVTVHCAALSPSLLESELFGHVKGAFTDAREARVGRFQLAEGGTLFLDEIGDISLETQVKLLRVLQERVIEPVGGSQPVPVDVRLVAATHQNLERLIADGQFREDLYYRLNVITITLPPLRERREDLFDLSLHFLRRACEKTGKHVSTIDDFALRLLTEHAWPGNIRELQNVIERAVVLAENGIVTVDDLPGELRGNLLPATARPVIEETPAPRRRRLTADALSVPRRIVINGSSEERSMLEDALRRCSGNKADAARLLGLPRSTFFSKLKKHGLG
ncbi:MAG: sigma-54-dependent Fis family transcriptional regulator [Planctomyces sp.]|nr:sigma-54-dependent Fis family transcriptional regulator [Planctomyces sp.]